MFFRITLLWMGLMAGAAVADAPYPVLLGRYDREIREHPDGYSQRVERAYLILEHGDLSDTAGDIDTLFSHSRFRSEGKRLRAIQLHHQGRLEEAKALIQKNIGDGVHMQEQARLLADIELSGKDTVAAIAAFHLAWAQDSDETDYLNLLELYRGRRELPEELLKQGLRIYPRSPGAIQTIFEVYFAAGDSDHMRKCLEISERAEKTLWPFSLDWKVRHARALMALHQLKEAEPVLQQALDLMDGDPRLQTNSGDTPLLRKEIFTMLEKCRE